MISKMSLKKCKFIFENGVCQTSLKDCRCFVCLSHECILDILRDVGTPFRYENGKFSIIR